MNKRRFLTKNQFKSSSVIVTMIQIISDKYIMSILRGLIILVGIFSVYSCDIFKNEQLEVSELQGEWVWERSIGGWGFEVDADTANYTILLTISELNATWFYNGEIMSKYIVTDTDQNKPRLLLESTTKFDGHYLPSKYVERLDSNTLVLLDRCYDCSTYYFSKSN